MTAHERTGFRDEALSRRHREWGYDCPATDVDLLLLEYDRGLPAAVIDYKHRSSQVALAEQTPNLSALGSLYDRDGKQLPFFVVYYDPDTWAFKFYPMNEQARWRCGDSPGPFVCDERGWVSWLHYLRGRIADEKTLSTRNTIQWEEGKT